MRLIYVDGLMLNPVEERTSESTLNTRTSNDRLNSLNESDSFAIRRKSSRDLGLEELVKKNPPHIQPKVHIENKDTQEITQASI